MPDLVIFVSGSYVSGESDEAKKITNEDFGQGEKMSFTQLGAILWHLGFFPWVPCMDQLDPWTESNFSFPSFL